MKRNIFLKLSTIALFALASCGETPATSSSAPVSSQVSVVESSSESTSSVASSSEETYPDVTMKFTQDSYEIERGEIMQIRCNVTTTATTKTVNFTVEQDSVVVELPDQTEGVPGSIKVTAKKVGTATLVATSTVNPNVSARVTITVIKRIPALSKVWSGMLAKDNYTINTYRAPSDTELDENPDYDEDTKIPYTRVKVTENALINETASYDEDTDTYNWKNTYSYSPEAESEYAGCDLWGTGVDKNGKAFNLITDADGNLKDAGDIVKTSYGLLDKDTFHGLGEEATSPNDAGTFFGLEACNPNWLPTAKVSGNEYEIEGSDADEEHENMAYAEYILWGLMDSYGEMETIDAKSVSSFVDIAGLVDITVTALTSDSITMSLTQPKAMEDGSDLVLTAEITDIDTTVIDEIAGLDTYLAAAEASLPALGTGLQKFVDAAAGNDYVYSYTLTINSSAVSYYVYYTTEYVMCYYPADFCAAYNSYTGQTTFNPNGESYGYAKISKGIAEFEFDFSDAENPQVTVYDDDQYIIGDSSYNIYDDLGYSVSLTGFPSYLNYTALIADQAIYAASDTAEEFTGLGNFYYSYGATLVEAIGELFSTSAIIDDTVKSAVSGISVTMKGLEIDSVSFLCAVVDTTSQDGYYSLYYTPTYSHFGTASSQNPYDSVLRSALANY